MQNIDFYDGKIMRDMPPLSERNDPEYFSRMSKIKHKEEIKSKKKASRIIFLITAFSIISFTTGIVVGIKYAGGSERKIIDEQTFKAVSDLGTKVNSMIKDNKSVEKFKRTAYPKEEFPFVIKIGRGFDDQQAQDIAGFLSGEGHTVIISKGNKKNLLYTGPYKNDKEAQDSLKKINDYTKYSLSSGTKILKRN